MFGVTSPGGPLSVLLSNWKNCMPETLHGECIHELSSQCHVEIVLLVNQAYRTSYTKNTCPYQRVNCQYRHISLTFAKCCPPTCCKAMWHHVLIKAKFKFKNIITICTKSYDHPFPPRNSKFFGLISNEFLNHWHYFYVLLMTPSHSCGRSYIYLTASNND